MSDQLPRFFVERITDIDADTGTGNVKLTYAVRSHNANHDVVQLVMHVNDLKRVFGEVWDELQKSFDARKQTASPAPAGAGRPGDLTDLTAG